VLLLDATHQWRGFSLLGSPPNPHREYGGANNDDDGNGADHTSADHPTARTLATDAGSTNARSAPLWERAGLVTFAMSVGVSCNSSSKYIRTSCD